MRTRLEDVPAGPFVPAAGREDGEADINSSGGVATIRARCG